MTNNEQYFKSEQDRIRENMSTMLLSELLDTYYWTRKEFEEYGNDETTEYTHTAWEILCETVYIIQEEITKRCETRSDI